MSKKLAEAQIDLQRKLKFCQTSELTKRYDKLLVQRNCRNCCLNCLLHTDVCFLSDSFPFVLTSQQWRGKAGDCSMQSVGVEMRLSVLCSRSSPPNTYNLTVWDLQRHIKLKYGEIYQGCFSSLYFFLLRFRTINLPLESRRVKN